MNIKHLLLLLASTVIVFATVPSAADVSFGKDTIIADTEITVTKPGPNLQGIINGIGDAGIFKRYVIRLGPGVYTIDPFPDTGTGLVMKPYVSIVGSGQEATVLVGSISSSVLDATAAIVSGADYAALTDLGIQNNGSGENAIAILNNNASPRIQDVVAIAIGSATNNYGVRNDGSSPTLINVLARAENASSFNIGIRSDSASPTLVNVIAEAMDGDTSRGVYYSFSSGTMVNVFASASLATSSNQGLRIVDGSPRINSSRFEGMGVGATGIENTSAGSRITNTRIVGGVSNDDAATNCRDNYDENLADVAC